MPELPEVETIVRDLNKSILHKTFSEVIVHDAFVLRQKSREFIRRLKGRTITQVVRRGKAVIMHLESPARVFSHEEAGRAEEFLVAQLMMTGQLIGSQTGHFLSVANSLADKHTRITFIFSDGSKLLYNDQRRFGQLGVVKNLKEIKYFNILGPEPFSQEFTPAYVRKVLKKSARSIKNLLLDHTFVAGIGNIYACEILFRSGINPKRLARRISSSGADVIYRQIMGVLREAISYRGSSMRNYRDGIGQKGNFSRRLAVYARQGLPCPRCGALIQRILQGSRSTFYCTRCQK